MSTKSEITPKTHSLVIDLLREAGVDVSDWKNFKGGLARAAANPKYCYEWSFIKPNAFVVINLWIREMIESDGMIVREFNMKKFSQSHSGVQKKRAERMFNAIEMAYTRALPVRVIICDGEPRIPGKSKANVKERSLDPQGWAVVAFDRRSGHCKIVRGVLPEMPADITNEVDYEGFEGKKLQWYIWHRRREAKLRKQKIAEVASRNNGRLKCEVKNCGFDFFEKYGEIGAGYAHVHHKEPLSDAPEEGRKVTISELAVVCANCHAMIHAGGQCRAIDNLIPT